MSEGRDHDVVAAIARSGGRSVLDVHSDADHQRSVITLAGTLADVETAGRAVVTSAVDHIDLRDHHGVHPRFGAADVVPVVPLVSGPASWTAAVETRDRLADWIGSELGVPCFLYGPERSLPEVRRTAFHGLEPDTGPKRPHPTAGAAAVGVRKPLVAYNLWLEPARAGVDVRAVARELASGLRSPKVRALGLSVGAGAQVSCNLLDATGPTLVAAFDDVDDGARARGCHLARAELVGLLPGDALAAVPRERWRELGVGEDATIEHRWSALRRDGATDLGNGSPAG